jgi:fumarate reductase subunit C
MSATPTPARTYRRSMRHWWRRDPFFRRYMLREATAVAVALYAVVLACGVVCLALGEPAWDAWRGALRSPPSLLLHLVLFAAMIVHARSWFEIMPKTMPPICIAGRRLAPGTITRAGWAAAILASVALPAALWWWRP